MRLLIKGNRQDAIAAVSKWGISSLGTDRNMSWNETWLYVSDSNRLKVIQWYCDPSQGEAPYPPGTLLFYSETPNLEVSK